MTTVQNFKNSSVSPPPTKLGVSHLGHPVTLEEVCSTFMVKMYRIAKKLLRHTTSELEVCIEKCHVTDYTLKKENFHSYELQLFQHLKEKDSLNGKQKFVNGFSITLKIMTISEVNERNWDTGEKRVYIGSLEEKSRKPKTGGVVWLTEYECQWSTLKLYCTVNEEGYLQKLDGLMSEVDEHGEGPEYQNGLSKMWLTTLFGPIL